MTTVKYIDPEIASTHRMISWAFMNREQSDTLIQKAIMLSENISMFSGEFVVFWKLEYGLCYRQGHGFFILDSEGYVVDNTDRSPMDFDDGIKMWISYSNQK